MDLSTVKTALANACSSISGLSVYGYMPNAPVLPAWVVYGVTIDPDFSFGDTKDDVTIDCFALTSHADDKSGQSSLDELISRTGTRSIRAALKAAVPSFTAADVLHIQSINGYQLYEFGGTEYYGARIRVRVIG